MSDGEVLLVVLAAAVVLEGVVWLPRGAVAFLAPFGSRRRPFFPEGALAGRGGAVVLATPLPPVSAPILCREPPIERVPWDSLVSVAADDRRVTVNGAPFVRAAGPAEALRLAREIGAVAAGGETALDAWLSRALDAVEAKRRIEEFARLSREPRLLANALLGYMFLAIPAATRVFPPERLWLPAILGLSCLMVWLLPAWFAAHRALYPAEKGDRLRHLFAMLFFPPAAVRCADSLSKPLLLDLHPLAAATVLCGPDDFRALARRYLRETANPLPGPRAGFAGRAREKLLRKLSDFIRSRGEDPDALLAPAPPSSPSVLAACPRCGAEYELPDGECRDCGLPLVPVPRPAIR
jgi:hypothetical protein